MGNIKNVAKTAKKEQLIIAYNDLFESKRFLGSEPIEDVTEHVKNVKIDDKPKEVVEVVDEGPPKFFKSVLKKGDKTNFPKKGDNVSCWYTGSLEDGTVFDTNIPATARKKKQSKPLSFKVGLGRVIRGNPTKRKADLRGRAGGRRLTAETYPACPSLRGRGKCGSH
ncbi:hypothetical protein J4Q44_G00322210 [Coregonus suidteri]|uniref:peptidylprolyl isomerase n=1 Tax=Coregonus suidteri TaxID=861788 RepID=A0AAN8KTA9_9TELE